MFTKIDSTFRCTSPMYARAVLYAEVLSLRQELGEAAMSVKVMQSNNLISEKFVRELATADEIILEQGRQDQNRYAAEATVAIFKQKEFRVKLLETIIDKLTSIIPDGSLPYTWNYDLADYIETTTIDESHPFYQIALVQLDPKVTEKFIEYKTEVFKDALLSICESDPKTPCRIGKTK